MSSGTEIKVRLKKTNIYINQLSSNSLDRRFLIFLLASDLILTSYISGDPRDIHLVNESMNMDITHIQWGVKIQVKSVLQQHSYVDMQFPH